MDTSVKHGIHTVKGLLETEYAIELVKSVFSSLLAKKLNLVKVQAPLVVLDGTGINDDLNGTERPVRFTIKALDDKKAVVVQSLAKWKRVRLKELGIIAGKGILTDMHAIRPDEEFSSIHSVYVDQWDWEKHILPENRNLIFLKHTVENIYDCLRATEMKVFEHYPAIVPVLPAKIHFVHAEELLKLYPHLSPRERENAVVRMYGAVFVIGIGAKLSNGEPHDGRAPDYDDWSSRNEDGYQGLNGDILLWNPVLNASFEVSSMGIRVDSDTLINQLRLSETEDLCTLCYHRQVLNNNLPQSIGGGIGQSRVCMFMLRKNHISQVQVSVWPEEG